MSARKYHLHDGKRGAALAVRVTPRASRNEITEILDDGTVKIRITAAPTDNEANEKLIKFLAEVLDVAPSRLDIVAGTSGRDKLIAVVDIENDEVQDRLMAYMQ
jgi:uncharacterized protein (TIGR00251 family)